MRSVAENGGAGWIKSKGMGVGEGVERAKGKGGWEKECDEGGGVGRSNEGSKEAVYEKWDYLGKEEVSWRGLGGGRCQ